jgi:hypothetical protein
VLNEGPQHEDKREDGGIDPCIPNLREQLEVGERFHYSDALFPGTELRYLFRARLDCIQALSERGGQEKNPSILL